MNATVTIEALLSMRIGDPTISGAAAMIEGANLPEDRDERTPPGRLGCGPRHEAAKVFNHSASIGEPQDERATRTMDSETAVARADRRAAGAGGAAVLVVEDERELAEEIRFELEAAGHRVRVVGAADEGLAAARSAWASVLVLDRMLGDGDGLSIVEALRNDGDRTPVLVISGLSSVDQRICGLKAGGDDYLIKPFDVRELRARVEALLRRGADSRATRLKVGVLEMDLVDRSLRCEGRRIDLLPKEFQLLEYFMRRPGQIVTRAMLLEDVWKFNFMAQTNVVDVQIGNLRRKLDLTGQRKFIVNVRAVGFRLDADD